MSTPRKEVGRSPVIPSAQVREDIRPADGSPTLVSFSRGKDAIAALLALRESGHDVRCFHLDLPPGLRFVDESLTSLEKQMGLGPTLRLPHPALYRHLQGHVFRPPGQLRAAESTLMWKCRWSYDDCSIAAREHFGLTPSTWVADGVRAADSPIRLAAMKTHGPLRRRGHQAHVIWDWKAVDIEAIIRRHGVRLPVDYRLWGRSWDGVDARFLGPLREHLPGDYARVLEWYPLADLELFRRDVVRASR